MCQSSLFFCPEPSLGGSQRPFLGQDRISPKKTNSWLRLWQEVERRNKLEKMMNDKRFSDVEDCEWVSCDGRPTERDLWNRRASRRAWFHIHRTNIHLSISRVAAFFRDKNSNCRRRSTHNCLCGLTDFHWISTLSLFSVSRFKFSSPWLTKLAI